MLWTEQGLRKAGFVGWVPFGELTKRHLPHGRGMYVIVRPDATGPEYLETSTAGWHKGRNPTVPAATLDKHFIREAAVVYIGRQGPLASGPCAIASCSSRFSLALPGSGVQRPK
jgi:hypothetical protein